MTTQSPKKNHFLKAAVALAALAAAFAVFNSKVHSTAASPASEDEVPQKKRAKGPGSRINKFVKLDYSRFTHRSAAHSKQSCDACHKFPSANWKDVRKGDESFADVTDFPQHTACLKCHREQFYSATGLAPVICSVCHIKVTPRNSDRYSFPSLGLSSNIRQGQETDFAVNFPHLVHADVIGALEPGQHKVGSVRFTTASFQQQPAPNKNDACATCHQTYQPQGKSDEEFSTPRPKGLADEIFWLKKSTFKTVPSTHASCFTCHSMDSGIKPASSDCSTCHKLLAPGLDLKGTDFDAGLASKMKATDPVILARWERRESAGKYPHDGGGHPDLECKSCHNTSVMNTVDMKSLKVPVMSCGGGGTGCHITATVDDGGILNFEVQARKTKPDFQCAKCHITQGTGPIPESHLTALAKTK